MIENRGHPRETVIDRFRDSLEQNPEAIALRFVEGSGEVREFTHSDLFDSVCRAARGLREVGLQKGDRIVVAFRTTSETLGLYLAAQVMGVIPLFLPEARGQGGGEYHCNRINDFAAAVDARFVFLDRQVHEELGADLVSTAISQEDLWQEPGTTVELRVEPGAVAHLQATSGSTGQPKIVGLRHNHISANVYAIGEAIAQGPGDQVVSWLPLYHDMGLICLSCVLHWQCPLVLTDSSNFVRHPINGWLKLIGRFQATISPAPTSAYQVCSRLARRVRPGDLDLSSWRVAFCGAEPVRATALRNFEAAFGPHGLSPTTLLPVYGLAEATLAVSIPSIKDRWECERIDRAALASDGRGQLSTAEGVAAVEIVSVGKPLAGHLVRVSGPSGQPLPARTVGEVEVAGPSVVSTYWNGEVVQREGFLPTGDLGYEADGRLFITGRKKEIIICYGRNLVPSQVEAVVEKILDTGIHQGVAAFGVPNRETASEDLHLLVEARGPQSLDRDRMEERIRSALLEIFEVGGAFIHWVKKGQIPKTTSGKIQRYRSRRLVESGICTGSPSAQGEPHDTFAKTYGKSEALLPGSAHLKISGKKR
jgi:fatty-acyl-CoA synthase